MRIQKLTEVVDWQLCLGCGACAYVCPDRKVQLMDFVGEGIRPVLADENCGDCTLCLQVCPAVQSDFSAGSPAGQVEPVGDFEKEWGPVLEIWEGYAVDPEIRFKGSSGGALTAIGAFCLEELGMRGVLHIGQDEQDPVRNRTRLSCDRTELMTAVGSRYAPASVCNGLGLVEATAGPCAVIGKPAEIAAVQNARKLRPGLAEKIGLTLSFFCAETPSTQGTLALLAKMGMKAEDLSKLSYRGDGWPGHFAPVRKGEAEPCAKVTYRESWSFLQSFRPWSTHLWPDGSGELADISCGDPWYEEPDGKNPGSSLIVVRTERGREILRGAVRAGYLKLTAAERWKLEKSQPGLLKKKGATWGRHWALRMAGLPVTELKGMDLFHCWKGLNFEEKLRSTLGTLRRILQRGFRRPLKLDQREAKVVATPEILRAKA